MNFTRHYALQSSFYFKDKAREKFNLEILDAILDDDADTFTELCQKDPKIMSGEATFEIDSYTLPQVFIDSPTYASLCAFFSSKKCFDALINLYPEGIHSPQFKHPDNYDRSIVLFACAGGNLDIIRELVNANFKLRTYDYEYKTPSHYAAMAGHLDVIKYLFANDITPVRKGVSNLSALHIASLYGYIDIVKFICESATSEQITECINVQSARESSPIHLACAGGHSDILEYLLSLKELDKNVLTKLDKNSLTPLACAIKADSLDCVKILVKTGLIKFDNNKKAKMHLPLVDACSYGFLDIVQYLISLKCIDIDAINSQDFTALDEAVINDRCDIVKCLIDNGAFEKYKKDDEKLRDLFLRALSTDDMDMVELIDESFTIPYNKYINEFFSQACMLESVNLIFYLKDKHVEYDINKIKFDSRKLFNNFHYYCLQIFGDLPKTVKIELISHAISYSQIRSLNELFELNLKVDAEDICPFLDFPRISCNQEMLTYLFQLYPRNVVLLEFLKKSNIDLENNKRKLIGISFGLDKKILEGLYNRTKAALNAMLANIKKNDPDYKCDDQKLIEKIRQSEHADEIIEIFGKNGIPLE